jgi:hypothetical protein
MEQLMDPKIFASVVEGGIPFSGGLFGTLLAYRVIGKKLGEDASYDELHQKYWTWFRWGGPLLMAFGVFQVIAGVLMHP